MDDRDSNDGGPTGPSGDGESVTTGVRRIATQEQLTAFVGRLRNWAKEARGFEMVTGDDVVDAIAETVELLRDRAAQYLARRGRD